MSDGKLDDQMWAELAVQSQNGDKKAYNKLLNEVNLLTKKYLASKVANPDWLEDIAQEVLISVHKSLHTYSPERPFKPWLLSIVNFRKTDFLRKHYSSRDDMKSPVEVLDFQKNNVTFSGYEGELKDIEEALDSLPEKQKKIFQLVKIEGYTVKEVATKMDMSESAIKVSTHRSSAKLSKLLGGSRK